MHNDTEIRVRYKETDQMGIAHHSNYYPWFEVARTEFIRSLGVSYRSMEDMGFRLPLLESHCVYKQAARYDDQLTIRTRITDFNGVRLTLIYTVRQKEDNSLLAEGSTVHVFTDAGRKPINLKKFSPYLYQMFLNCLAEEDIER